MKIGIDIDGVILDYERVLRTYGELYDCIELKKEGLQNKQEIHLKKRYNWTEEEYMDFVKKYFIKLSKKTELLPGAKDVIQMLQKEGHEFIIISARGNLIVEMEEEAEKKFKKENLVFSKYYWEQLNKLEVAQKEKIDYMIDDNFEICQNLSKNGIKVIYFRDKDIKPLEPSNNLIEVSNWGEIYRILTK